jgi:D-alanine-D-alanine ligase
VIKVAVVYGGRSGEHEISIRSAESILAGLDPAKYEVKRIFITKEGRWQPEPILPEPGGNRDIDVVFPVLHGTFGEDGTIQGLCELAGLAYVGTGVFASAACMDKDFQKRLMRERGIPVVDFLTVDRDDILIDDICMRLPFFPLFVKPANLGSSVGISKAKNRSELETAVKLAAEFDRKIIVERAVNGREFECAVLGNEKPEAAIPCEVLPSREFYDYEDKYLLNTSKTILPAPLEPAKTDELRRMAVEAYRSMGCEGLSRVDFLMDGATGELFVNEINTMPGFTSISMYPKMWEAAGLGFGALLDKLIELAMERNAVRQSMRYSR